MTFTQKICAGVLCLGSLMAITGPAAAQSQEDQERIERLEQLVEQLSEQVRQLQNAQNAAPAAPAPPAAPAAPVSDEDFRAAIAEEVELQLEDSKWDTWDLGNKLDVGGYAEIHANFNNAGEGDQIDIHRFVLDFRYDFNEWIKFFSEVEIEHGFISDDDGEIVLEQFYVDFLLSEHANLRIGRVLAPLGIINKRHEPPTFNGVERPLVDTVMIPTTWSVDGAGLYGNITDSLTYEAYVVGGLDGSQFSPISGIRSGRIKERPSLNDLAITGRLDYFPFVDFSASNAQTLRLGLSGFYGGLDNGDQGSDPGLSGTSIGMISADFEYSIGRFDLRGVGVYTMIDNADKLPMGVAEEMAGWYIEPAVHVMPEKWKKGKLADSDLVLFTRYEDVDTQRETVSGVASVPGGDREELTLGASFFFTPAIVLKADYQFVDSDAPGSESNRWNLGLGMQF